MNVITVTAKGQVTLKKDLLRHLGVNPGDRIAIDKLPDGRLQARAVKPSGRIADVFDLFKDANGPTLSIEEINEIAAEGWAGKA